MSTFPLHSKLRLKSGHEKDGVWKLIGGHYENGPIMKILVRDGDGQKRTIFNSALDLYERILPTVDLSCQTKRRIVIDCFVTVNGKRFNADDMLEALVLIEADDRIIVDDSMGDFLVEIGVLDSCGTSSWSSAATKGPRFDEFLAMLRDAVERAREASSAA